VRFAIHRYHIEPGVRPGRGKDDKVTMGYGIGAGGSYGYAGGGATGLLWGLGSLLLLVGVVLLVVWVASRMLSGRQDATSEPTTPRPEPLEILKARFARGEISEADFQQARRVLGYER
jgi:putative membrane protein